MRSIETHFLSYKPNLPYMAVHFGRSRGVRVGVL